MKLQTFGNQNVFYQHRAVPVEVAGVQDDIFRCSAVPLEDGILLEHDSRPALLEHLSHTAWEGNAALATEGQVLGAPGLDIKLRVKGE